MPGSAWRQLLSSAMQDLKEIPKPLTLANLWDAARHRPVGGTAGTSSPTANTPPPTSPPDALPREISSQTSLDVTLTPCSLEIFFTLSRITYIETTFPIN